MNFFQRQILVRRQSRLLVALFVLSVIGIIVSVAFVISVLFKLPMLEAHSISAICVLTVVIGATWYRLATFKGGGAVIAQQLGGELIDEHTSDLELQRLRNVVEEMSIASGVPVPDIFVLNKEMGINAFASGYSTSDAAITVTRGALKRLNRDELQGVVAHEFSHILNGDMRLNIRMVGVLFGIMIIGLTGQRMLTNGRFRGKNAGVIYQLALLLMVIGFIGFICGRLIKAGINRQREYLADACAVQFTRQNLGISGALKKIGGVKASSTIENANAEEFNHMFFGQGISSYFQMMATHPPLIERIKALEPKFSEAELTQLKEKWEKNEPDGMQEDIALGLSGGKVESLSPLSRNQILAAVPTMVIQQVGTMLEDNHRNAAELLQQIPPELTKIAHNYHGAMPLLFALLYSADAAIQEKQNKELLKRYQPVLLANTQEFYQLVKELPRIQRLPLASLCMPAIRQRSGEKLTGLIDAINALMRADGDVSLYEYSLGSLLTMQIQDYQHPQGTGMPGKIKLTLVAKEASQLIAVFADVGNRELNEINKAYLAGMACALPGVNIPYQKTNSFVETLDPIWSVLDKVEPNGKKALIEGLVAAIQADNQMSVEEGELLRVVCAALHCPLPLN